MNIVVTAQFTDTYSRDCSHQYWRIQSFTDEYSRSLTHTVVTVLVSTDEYSHLLMNTVTTVLVSHFKTNIFSARPKEASVENHVLCDEWMNEIWKEQELFTESKSE